MAVSLKKKQYEDSITDREGKLRDSSNGTENDTRLRQKKLNKIISTLSRLREEICFFSVPMII